MEIKECTYDTVLLRHLEDILQSEEFSGKIEEISVLLEYFPMGMLGKAYKVRGVVEPFCDDEKDDLEKNLRIMIEEKDGCHWYIPARFTKEYLLHGIHSFVLPINVVANIERMEKAIQQINECLSEVGDKMYDCVGNKFIDYFFKMKEEFGGPKKVLDKIAERVLNKDSIQ